MIALGEVETLKGRMISFPNSHIHKVTTLTKSSTPKSETTFSSEDRNKESTKEERVMSKRRIVVFFLVNPLKRIISTREVAPQQIDAGGSMSLEDALKHRLELMKERRLTKQDFNVRKVHLCEH